MIRHHHIYDRVNVCRLLGKQMFHQCKAVHTQAMMAILYFGRIMEVSGALGFGIADLKLGTI